MSVLLGDLAWCKKCCSCISCFLGVSTIIFLDSWLSYWLWFFIWVILDHFLDNTCDIWIIVCNALRFVKTVFVFPLPFNFKTIVVFIRSENSFKTIFITFNLAINLRSKTLVITYHTITIPARYAFDTKISNQSLLLFCKVFFLPIWFIIDVRIFLFNSPDFIIAVFILKVKKFIRFRFIQV